MKASLQQDYSPLGPKKKLSSKNNNKHSNTQIIKDKSPAKFAHQENNMIKTTMNFDKRKFS